MEIKVGDWVYIRHSNRVFKVDEIRYLEGLCGCRTQVAVKDRWFGRSWIGLDMIEIIRAEKPLPPPPEGVQK